MAATLKKVNIIRSKIEIETLFSKGKSFQVSPLRVIYLPVDKNEYAECPKVLFTVSKRFFKSAVDRNRIRRRIKEAFRRKTEWGKLWLNENKPLNIALLYQVKEELSYQVIEEKIVLILQKLEKISASETN